MGKSSTGEIIGILIAFLSMCLMTAGGVIGTIAFIVLVCTILIMSGK